MISQRELALNGLMIGFARSLLEDIPDDALAAQPFAGANHAAWVLGHLAVTADRVGQLLGQEAALPESWDRLFGRESSPVAERVAYPAKAELLSAFEGANAQLVAAAGSASAEQLAAANTFSRLAKLLPTKGDLIAMILTTHIAQHLGQLSAWRRATGKPPLF